MRIVRAALCHHPYIKMIDVVYVVGIIGYAGITFSMWPVVFQAVKDPRSANVLTSFIQLVSACCMLLYVFVKLGWDSTTAPIVIANGSVLVANFSILSSATCCRWRTAIVGVE